MPDADVVRLEEDFPGYIAARIAVWTSRIYAQLSKRYAVPFSLPAPEIVLGWITSLATVDAYKKRGWNPSDEQSAEVLQDAKDALTEIQLAADAVTGLFDLPLLESSTKSGISKGAPLVYSEASPYTWTDVEVELARAEDRNGRR